MTHILIPREPSTALLRPFIGCNTQELHEAWAAMVRIAEVQHARAGSQCLAQIEEPAQPVCWIRFCSDGSTEGPIMHSQICEARKTSGAWTPLYAGAAPAAVSPRGEYPHEQMDAMALDRYKVVPSNASMLWSHAVVAGDGTQQLYVGREVECQNMARKFAGAFLDGAFAFHSTAAAPTAPAAPALEAPAAPALAQRLRTACLSVRSKSYPLSDLIPLMQQAADALAAAPQAPAQAAPAAPGVPAGFALVPIEPTQQMLDAGRWSGAGSVSIQEEWARKEVWSRMLATVAPPPAAYADDLVALVVNLVQALSAVAPDNDLASHALDYLKRNGLQGSPLQAAEAAPQAPAAPVDEQSARDSICAWSVWWTHNKAKFTTPRQAAIAAWNHANERALRAMAAPAAPAVDAWLQPADMAALQRFQETAEDDESYDIGKDAVARLCAFGCLQSHSFGRYSTTDFGDYLLGVCASARTLPFATAADRRDRAAQAKEGGAA